MQRLVETVGPRAVVLHSGADPVQLLLGEMVDHLRGEPLRGDPVHGEPGPLGGSAGLGTPGQHPGVGERGAQRGTGPGGVGGLEPAAHPHPGGDQQQLGRTGDELLGALQQLRIGDVRDDAHRGGMPDLGAVTRQGGGELLGTALEGEHHAPALERAGEAGRRSVRRRGRIRHVAGTTVAAEGRRARGHRRTSRIVAVVPRVSAATLARNSAGPDQRPGGSPAPGGGGRRRVFLPTVCPCGTRRCGAGRRVSFYDAVRPFPRAGAFPMTWTPTPEDDRRFLSLAIEQARKSWDEGGVPIGAVLVHDGQVLAAGHNQRVQKDSAILHGETDTIEKAGRLRASVYRESVLYTTLSPCIMCSGTALLYEIPRIVVGENRTFEMAEGLLRERGVVVDVLDDPECIALMERMIAERPEIWSEDIGVETGELDASADRSAAAGTEGQDR
jgi:creatinine deaminase